MGKHCLLYVEAVGSALRVAFVSSSSSLIHSLCLRLTFIHLKVFPYFKQQEFFFLFSHRCYSHLGVYFPFLCCLLGHIESPPVALSLFLLFVISEMQITFRY